MDYSGTFPFGWIRNFHNNNWQIIWDKNSGDFFIKSVSGEVKSLQNFKNWKDAKEFADKIIENNDLIKLSS